MKLNVWHNKEGILSAIDKLNGLEEYGILVEIQDFEFNNGYYFTKPCCEYYENGGSCYLVNNFDSEVISTDVVSRFMIIQLVDND